MEAMDKGGSDPVPVPAAAEPVPVAEDSSSDEDDPILYMSISTLL